MLAIKITDLKDFTNKLFLQEVFDHFWLVSADIATYNLFSIDGKLQKDFYDSDEQAFLDDAGRTHSLWKEVRPFCCSIIRGKRSPLYFKIILQLSPKKAAVLLEQSGVSLTPEQIRGLYINLQYKNKVLMCTTGTSLNTFLPGKQLDQLWDQTVTGFFTHNQITFETL